MNQTIRITIKDVYGKETIYPACEQSKRLAQLAGTKTLTRSALGLIESLGFVVQVQEREFHGASTLARIYGAVRS